MDEKRRANVFFSILIGAFVGLMIFFIFYATFDSFVYLIFVPIAALLSGAQAFVMPERRKKKD